MQELGAEDNIAGAVSSMGLEEPGPAPDIFGARPGAGGGLSRGRRGGRRLDLGHRGGQGGRGRVAAVMTGGLSAGPSWRRRSAYAVYEDCHELLEVGFPRS